MKNVFIALAALVSTSPVFAAEVSASISVAQPGLYGRIDIGDLPHPELVYRQPLIIKPVVGVVREPIYLHIPPGHAKDWAKHCHRYNACSERVFFVQERWYTDVYVPHRKPHAAKAAPDHRSKDEKHDGKH